MSMDHIEKVAAEIRQAGWFGEPGAYTLVDGQFGSTGKGLLASLLGYAGQYEIDIVTTNAGPNSGHTGNYPGTDDLFMTQQVPCASVVLGRADRVGTPTTYINSGAIIDVDKLIKEQAKFNLSGGLVVSSRAAVITAEDLKADEASVQHVASTGKGVGPALARKISRDRKAVVGGWDFAKNNLSVETGEFDYWQYAEGPSVTFVETAQGFSLGIHSHFYPHTTSRECTVAQALADARIAPQELRKVAMTVRTFPIRVGNTESGYSGDWYKDQTETTWEAIGVAPEYTSVTKRVRRVADWSWNQFRQACEVNHPDLIFVNFLNYLKTEEDRQELVDRIRDEAETIMSKEVLILGGYGPKVSDIRIMD